MYRTEGYVDQESYLVEEHVRSHVIRYQGRLCFCWWVCKEEGLQDICCKIRSWMQQELPAVLGRGVNAIRKELNRFGSFINRGEVFLYYQGKLWQYTEKTGAVLVNRWSRSSAQIGLFVSESLEKLKEVQELIKGIMEEKYVLKGNGCEGNEELTQTMCLTQLANRLQTISLLATSEGRLQQGYFFLWEAADAF